MSIIKNIYIEYCEQWNYQPEFDRVSKIILSIDDSSNIVGNEENPRTGSFEVVINNQLVFSKFKVGRFPNESEIYSWFN